MPPYQHEETVVGKPIEANNQKRNPVERQHASYSSQGLRERLLTSGHTDRGNGSDKECEGYCGHVVGNRAHPYGSCQVAAFAMGASGTIGEDMPESSED